MEREVYTKQNIVSRVLAIVLALAMVLPVGSILSGQVSGEPEQITAIEESSDSFIEYHVQSLDSVERDLILPTIGPLPLQWNETRDFENDTDVPLTPRGESIIVNITPPTAPPPEVPKPSKETIVLPNPDFTIKSIKTSELTILEGNVVFAEIFIDNVGLLWYEEIPVAIYDGDISPENLIVTDTAVFEKFSTEVSCVLSELSIGTHRITVFVDPYDEVEEQNEENNTAAFTMRVTTGEDWALSIIELIELLMAKVDATLDQPFSDVVNNNLIKAIENLEDAAEEYEDGDIEDAIESVNDAIDKVHLVTVKVKTFYETGKFSLADAQDIWSDAGIILERIVDLGRLYLNDPLADDIAEVEKHIFEVIIGAMIEIPDNNKWCVVYAHLAVSLNQFQKAMEELAEEEYSTQAIQIGYNALNQAKDKLSTFVYGGKIPEEFGNWALDRMETAQLVFAPDVVITSENISLDGLAVVGETSVISVIIENAGRTDVDKTKVNVYDETKNILVASKTIHQLNKDTQRIIEVYWTPSEIGTHKIRVSADPDNAILETIEDNNEARKGYYVITGTHYINQDVYIPPGQLIRWDSTNTSITNPQIVVSGNIIIDGILRIGDDYTVIMNCTIDNEYRIQVNVPGELTSNIGHFTSPGSDLTYSFLVGGELNLLYSTVQWVWGDTTGIIEYGGIQLFSNTIDIEGSEIFEGKTHGIYVDIGVTPNIISGNTIRNNSQAGILYRETSNGIIDNNNISGNTYGVYCYQASPTIMNNKNISWNTNSGIYNYYSSPSITGNTISNNTYGIDIQFDSTAVIEGNTIVDNLPTGVRCRGPAAVFPTIRNNPLFKDNTYGVHAFDSSPLVENNVFTGHWQAVLGQFSSATVHKNNIYGNTWGIEVWDSPSTFVASENTVVGNTYGLWCHQSDALFTDSPDISENDYGIYIRTNSNPTVTNNTVTANRYGVYSNKSSPTLTDNNISFNGMTTVFSDDMESGINGWTADGFWHQVENVTGAPAWNLSHSPTHSWWYGQDATGNYDNGSHNFGNLTTSELYLPINSTLTFWSWYGAEPGYDLRTVWINVSGGEWQIVEKYENYVASMYDWKFYSLDLSAYGNNNVQIRFSFDTQDEIYNEYQGWYIDDIRINSAFGAGVHIEEDSFSTLSGNDIFANGHGITVIENSNANIENNNVISSNIRYGIYTENSTLNVRKSLISYNHFGVYSRENIGDGINANTISPEFLSSTSYDHRTTFDDKNSTSPAITTDGLKNYMVWADDRRGNYEIYLMEGRARNGGWGDSFQRLTNTPYDSTIPDIAIDSSGIGHIVWREDEPWGVKVVYMNTQDLSSIELFNGSVDPYGDKILVDYPQIVIGINDVLHVIFSVGPIDSILTASVRYLNSTDGGATWSNIRTLGSARDRARASTLADKNGNIYVAWHDWTWDYDDFLINFVRSADNGGTWTSQFKLVNQPGNSTYPSLSVGENGIVHLVWNDDRTGDYEIYMKSSNDYGATWCSETRLTYAAGESFEPRIATDSNNNAHIVWQDNRDGAYKIHYLKVNATGVILVDDICLTPTTTGALYPDITLDEDDFLSIIWQDMRDNNWEIYAKYFSPLIENCEISNNTEVGVCIYNKSSLLIKDSLITSNGLTTGTLRWWIEGVGVLSSENTNLVMHNTSVRNNYFGVWVSASSVYATNNDISYNAARGFLVYEQSIAGIINNSIHDNCWSGFSSSQLSTGVIMNNTVTNNNYGFYFGNAYPLVLGNNISSNNMYGFYHKARSGVKIVGNKIMDNGADGIMVYSYYTYADKSVYIYENEILRNGWYGIYSDLGKTVIYNNTISYNTLNGIFVSRGWSGSHITNNKVEWNGEAGVFNHGADTYTQVRYNHINNNQYGIVSYYTSTALEIFNNCVTNSTGIGIFLCLDSNSQIEGNQITNNKRGIVCTGSTSSIINNEVKDNEEWGILCYDDADPTISGNTIEGNNEGGIYAHLSSPLISDNEDITLNGYGIYLYLSSSTISDNNITSNAYDGICSYHSSLVIEDNTISDNQNGITVIKTESNIQNAEYIDGTGYAIVVGSANNFGWPDYDADSMPAQTLQAYYTLKNRGYTDDRITFMLFHDDEPWVTGCEPGEDNDGTDEWISIYNMTVNDLWGLDGIQGTADDPVIDFENYDVTKDRMRAELRGIAENVTPDDKVLVYLMNHGTRRGTLGGFCFETGDEVAWEDEMNFWLQEIQRNCSKMYVLVDACFSGNFISTLPNPHRLCVSSAADVSGWAWVEAAPNIYAGSWFFHPFWDNISAGYSIQEAFEFAAQSKPYSEPDWWSYNKTVREIQGPQMQENLEGITADTGVTTIHRNDIKNNSLYGIYLKDSNNTNIENNTIGTGYYSMQNETVYEAIASTDTGPLYLDHGNVLNCSLYLDDAGAGWYKLEEWTDYTLNYDTGEIDTSAIEPFDVGWIFYAYYNYTIPGGNEYGIYSIHSSPKVANNRIAANGEDGVFIDNKGDHSLNPLIGNNGIIGNRQGISLFNGSATVIGNDILSNRGPGIELEKGRAEISLNTIKDNAEPRGPPPWVILTGIKMIESDSVWIHHNNISHNGANIYLLDSTNITVENNTIVDASAVILIYPTPPPPRGIHSISSQMIVSNNTIWGTIIGIAIENADATTEIRDNNFYPIAASAPWPARGIYLMNASVQVEGNTFDMVDTGIYVENSEPTIQYNHITHSGTGIYLEGAGSLTVIRYNNIDQNAYGIWYEQSSVPLIMWNNITNNEYGIYATSLLEDLTVWYNNIFGNTEYGVYNADPSHMVDARFNWWGDSTGAWHPINYPLGQGDWVSDNVNADIPEPALVEWW